MSAGAQWQVDGGAWQSSGATLSGLTVGGHTVTFSTVAGWTTPLNQNVTISANQTATATVTYVLLVTPPTQFIYITNGGTITVTGYTGPGGAVSIPGTINGLPVTRIGEAFSSCFSLTSVTIPDTVTNIGEYGFFYCTNLTNVTMYGGVTSIEVDAFEDCYNLTSVIMGNGVTSIGAGAFQSCIRLVTATIPKSVTSIGAVAFRGCSSLTSVMIGNSVTSIGEGAFQSCSNLTTVTIPNSVTDIGEGAFAQCPNLISATIGRGVTSIGDSAFDTCASLTGVYFRGNAPNANSSVFNGDAYATVYYLPDTIGWGPFFANRPIALWNAQVQPGSFGVRTNQFGFNITGNSNLVVVVEAASNLANSTWCPVQTNTLTGAALYFSDPQWTNYPGRFYRLRWP